MVLYVSAVEPAMQAFFDQIDQEANEWRFQFFINPSLNQVIEEDVIGFPLSLAPHTKDIGDGNLGPDGHHLLLSDGKHSDPALRCELPSPICSRTREGHLNLTREKPVQSLPELVNLWRRLQGYGLPFFPLPVLGFARHGRIWLCTCFHRKASVCWGSL